MEGNRKFRELERLRLVLEYMPDEELMVELEKERANGRDDYPVRAVWNSVLAGISIPASFDREFSTNKSRRD